MGCGCGGGGASPVQAAAGGSPIARWSVDMGGHTLLFQNEAQARAEAAKRGVEAVPYTMPIPADV